MSVDCVKDYLVSIVPKISNGQDLIDSLLAGNPLVISAAAIALVVVVYLFIKIGILRGVEMDVKVLHECTQKGVGLPIEKAFDVINREIHARYPHLINTKRTWMLFNGGGAMGQMCVLHASLTEYLIFYGAPLYSQGHSGRYLMDVYDFMIQGETKQYYPGEFKPRCYPAGTYSHLPRYIAKGYCIEKESYLVEYGRGVIPLALPYALCSSIFVTFDIYPWLTAAYHVGWEVTKNLLLRRKI